MNRTRMILCIFFFTISRLSGDSTIFLKLSQEEPKVSIISETARLVLGNCRADILYPRLEPATISNKKINLYLKKAFLDAKALFSGADCTPRFRKAEPAFYVEVKYSTGLNSGDFLSILSQTTGYVAKAKTTDIKKRGLNFKLSSGYSIFLDSILRPESGYRMGLEDALKQKLLDGGQIGSGEEFTKYQKKNYEFLLRDAEIEFLLEEGGQGISVLIPYGDLEKYLNKDIFGPP